MTWEGDVSYRLKDIKLFLMLFNAVLIFFLFLSPLMGFELKQVLPLTIVLIIVFIFFILMLNFFIKRLEK